jgi:hypothetical protein
MQSIRDSRMPSDSAKPKDPDEREIDRGRVRSPGKNSLVGQRMSDPLRMFESNWVFSYILLKISNRYVLF